ncbi:hypothetical protein FACS189499_06560 [Clostridia bacterium]|nr:hypothetical protein FACS189499_06560 [Clostridia bacterium]
MAFTIFAGQIPDAATGIITASASASTGALPAPGNFTAAINADDFDSLATQEAIAGVNFTWEKVDGAKSYNVYQLSAGKWVKIDLYNEPYFYESENHYTALLYYVKQDSKYNHTGFNLLPGTEYSFRVAAVADDGKVGAASPAVTVKTPDFRPPASNNQLLWRATTTSALFHFLGTAWADSYELIALFPGETKYRSIKKSDNIQVTYADDGGISSKTVYLAGLKADSSYSFKIRGVGVIGGKTVRTSYSKAIPIKTEKTTFDGKNTDAIIGSFLVKGETFGALITFKKDGTGTYDSNRYDYNERLYTGAEEQNFTYVSWLTSAGTVQVDIIGDDFAFAGYYSNDGKNFSFSSLFSPGEMDLVRITDDSVAEKGLDGKIFKYIKGDVIYSVSFPEHQNSLPKVQLSSSKYYSGVEVGYESKDLSPDRTEITIGDERDPVIVPHTFIYDKKKDTLTVTKSPSGLKTAIPKGTVLGVDYYDENGWGFSGAYSSADYDMSVPVISLWSGGTGTANPSGAVDPAEKMVTFMYDVTGNVIILNFKEEPGASLHGLQKGKVFGRIYHNVNIKKADKPNAYNIIEQYGVNGEKRILSTVYSDRNLEADGIRKIIVVNNHIYYTR